MIDMSQIDPLYLGILWLVLGGLSGFLWLKSEISLHRTRHLGGELLPGVSGYRLLLVLFVFLSMGMSIYEFLEYFK